MNSKFEIIEGVKCFAPDLAFENEGFDNSSFKTLYEAEEKNFWFISRNQVIQNLFQKYIGTTLSKILEIGCGTGYVLKGLEQQFPNYQLQGSEIHLEGIKFAQKRLPNIELIQLDATQMPFNNDFDAIGAFDVLEHIEEDKTVMKEVYKSLKDKGHFIITLPQYQWMWSINDDVAFHKRRYSKKELKQKLIDSGFELKYISSFVFILFPLMFFSRLLKGKYKKQNISLEETLKIASNELQLNPLLNSIFLTLMKIDVWLIRLGISLPFGGSLIAVAQKSK